MRTSPVLDLVLLNISTGPLEESTLDLPNWASLSKIWLQNSPQSAWGKIPESEEILLATWAPLRVCSLSPLPLPAEFDSWLWILTWCFLPKTRSESSCALWLLLASWITGLPAGETWAHPPLLPSQWDPHSCRPVCIILHWDGSHRHPRTAQHCQGLQVHFPALQDPGCTFNHYQSLLPWMLFLLECSRMWDLILSSSAVIQSGRKANKSLLLIGFQLSSNQFVLKSAGHMFNYCILPDTREMEGFLLVLCHLCWKVLQQLCKGRKNDGVIRRTSDDAKESNGAE